MIEIENVGRTFNTEPPVRALNGVSLSVAAGEFVSIAGPSGSGKSTLLNIMGLIDSPTAGSYRFEGREMREAGQKDLAAIRATRIGFVFQTFHLIESLNAIDNVSVGGKYSGTPRRERYRQAEGLIGVVGLEHRITAYPSTLSGGECQRVAIARALMGEKSLLLCDEPTGNLDEANTRSIADLLKGLSREGVAVVVVTHDSEVANEADRSFRISDGRIT